VIEDPNPGPRTSAGVVEMRDFAYGCRSAARICAGFLGSELNKRI
jgi:hypothetical protein